MQSEWMLQVSVVWRRMDDVVVSEIQLSVMLATRNGEHVLRRTLEGYVNAQLPSAPWELLVIDNGSTDGSVAILESFRSRLPLRVITESRPGKNRALNAGLEVRRGQLVVLTDDDAVPEKSFLVAWERVLGEHLDIDLFGGRIRPFFEVPPPRWLLASPHEFALMFGERDLAEGAVDAGELYGGNMAIRARVFDAGNRFAEGIGPDGSDSEYPMGSEVEFCLRVARSGAKSRFNRGPVVDHIVRPSQWTKKAWIRRAFRSGRGRAYIMYAHKNKISLPKVTWLDLLHMASPFRHQRYRALRALHLRRGFDMERARWDQATTE